MRAVYCYFQAAGVRFVCVMHTQNIFGLIPYLLAILKVTTPTLNSYTILEADFVR